MNIKCPKCEQVYDVAEDCFGKEAECIKCKHSFVIQNPKLVKCPACYGIVSKEALACPKCGQPIRSNSIEYNDFQKETLSEIRKPTADVAFKRINSQQLSNNLCPSGIGGWLKFFCIWLTIITPIFSFSIISENRRIFTSVFNTYPSLETALIWETIGSSILLGYGLITGVAIWKGHHAGLKLAKLYLVIRTLGFIIVNILVFCIISDLPVKVRNYFYDRFIVALPTVLIVFIIWWLYFKKSKRVRNTYKT